MLSDLTQRRRAAVVTPSVNCHEKRHGHAGGARVPECCDPWLISGETLLDSVHPSFSTSAEALLRNGGERQLLMQGRYGEPYVALIATTASNDGEQAVSVTYGGRITCSAVPGSSPRVLPYDPVPVDDGALVRVVVLLMTSAERLVLQYSPEKILQAVDARIRAAHRAAGSTVLAHSGGLGGFTFTGRFEDNDLASRIRDAVSSRQQEGPHLEFAVGEATGRWPNVLRGAVRAAGYAVGSPGLYWFADAAESDRFVRQHFLRDDLRKLMRSGELRLDLQPVVDSRSGRMVSAEALLRLDHQRFGAVSPDEILNAVAGTTLQHELDRWVVAEGIRLLRRLLVIAPWFKVDVNVTASILNSSGVVEFFRKHTAGLPNGAFGIEVSERDSFARLDLAAPKLSALRRHGIGVSLDDFGTGASSLACVSLPFDSIKIDRSFVKQVENDDASRGVCVAVAAIGEAVGARVIAEGVESEAHARYLNELGVVHHQGWLYAKALRFDDLVARLASP